MKTYKSTFIIIFIFVTNFQLFGQTLYYEWITDDFYSSETPEAYWPTTAINYSEIPDNDLPPDWTLEEVNQELSAAVSRWANEFKYSFNIYTGTGTVPVKVVCSDDPDDFGGTQMAQGVAGLTWLYWNPTINRIAKAEIFINTTSQFLSNFEWVEHAIDDEEMDFQSNMIHEFGHAIGMSGNEDNESSVMYHPTGLGEHEVFLSQDDSQAISNLFWETTTNPIVGIEDGISIADEPEVIDNPQIPYFFDVEFIDEYPYGDYIVNWDFEISALHCDGKYVLSTSDWVTGSSAINLPDDYCWLRDENDYVLGQIRATGIDNDYYYHEAIKTFKIVGVSYPTNIEDDMVWCGNLDFTNNLTLNSGATLSVASGTTIKFAPNKTLTVNGTFNVNGTSSNPVNFTRSGASGNWNYIKFNSGSSGTISYANIEYAKKGIYNQSDNVSIEDCIIEHFTEQGIYSSYGDLDVEDCIIRNPDGASHGIYTFFSDPTISGTKIYDINGIGFYHYFNASGTGTFSHGRIEGCSTGLKTYFSGLEIFNNYFDGNTYGIRTAVNSDEVDIHDNDFIDNNWGIYTEQSGPNEIKWNQFGKSGSTYDANKEASILINSGSIENNNSFLDEKYNNFYDGGLFEGIDIDNNSNYELNAEGNYWENYWYEGSVDVLPYENNSNTNAGPGGSLGKESGQVSSENVYLPTEFKLEQNFPNPFNPSTVIRFHLPEESNVTLTIYDMLGHTIKTITKNTSYQAGTHNLTWDGKNESGNNLSSGVYFYRITAIPKDYRQTFSDSRKLVYIR